MPSIYSSYFTLTDLKHTYLPHKGNLMVSYPHNNHNIHINHIIFYPGWSVLKGGRGETELCCLHFARFPRLCCILCLHHQKLEPNMGKGGNIETKHCEHWWYIHESLFNTTITGHLTLETIYHNMLCISQSTGWDCSTDRIIHEKIELSTLYLVRSSWTKPKQHWYHIP